MHIFDYKLWKCLEQNCFRFAFPFREFTSENSEESSFPTFMKLELEDGIFFSMLFFDHEDSKEGKSEEEEEGFSFLVLVSLSKQVVTARLMISSTFM